MRVSRWGNSLAVRLPAKLVQELGLKEGDEVKMTPVGQGAIEVEALRSAALDDLLGEVRLLRRPLPADFKFDRGEANER
jgi:antitoxin MazE